MWPKYGVGLEGRPGNRRVVLIETWKNRERTQQGVGVGTTQRKLIAVYRRRLRCERLWGSHHPVGEACTLGPGAGRRTVFIVPDYGGIVSGRPLPTYALRVSRVVVIEAGVKVRLV